MVGHIKRKLQRSVSETETQVCVCVSVRLRARVRVSSTTQVLFFTCANVLRYSPPPAQDLNPQCQTMHVFRAGELRDVSIDQISVERD
jgi:hypothetical protein